MRDDKARRETMYIGRRNLHGHTLYSLRHGVSSSAGGERGR
jgi:hypothetical protein